MYFDQGPTILYMNDSDTPVGDGPVTHEMTVMAVPYYDRANGVYISVEGELYPYGQRDEDGTLRAPENDYHFTMSPQEFSQYVDALVDFRNNLRKEGKL